MREDPIKEWQRLTEHYREMGDLELVELAADFDNLTEVARQVLRDEVKKRGLPEPRTAPFSSQVYYESAFPGDFADTARESDPPREYTWKTLLCECGDWEEAWQIREVLRQAGIESWIEGPRMYSDLSGSRVLVAADQLEQARQIAARPIPQEIIDLSKIKVPDFEPGVCPNCGAGDPILDGVNSSNIWRCGACGRQWTESLDLPSAGIKEQS